MAKTKPKTKVPLDPDEVIDDILEKFAAFPGIIGEFGNAIRSITGSFKNLFDAIGKLDFFKANDDDTKLDTPAAINPGQGALAASLEKLSAIIEYQLNGAVEYLSIIIEYQLVGAVEVLIATLEKLITTMSGSNSAPQPNSGNNPTPSPGSPLPLPGGGAATEGAEGAGAAGGALASIAAVGAVAAAALGAVALAAGLVERAFQKAEGWVRLFNPAVITLFHQALDNLGATIGRAFVPLFQDAIAVVKQFTGALAPVIAQLAPVVKQLADVFSNILLQVLKQFASVFQSLIPQIQRLGEIFALVANIVVAIVTPFTILFRALELVVSLLYELSGLGTIIRILNVVMEAFNQVMEIVTEAFNIFETVISTVLNTVVQALLSVIPVKEIMDALTRAVQSVIRNMYVFAVMLAKLAGLDSVVEALIRSVEGKNAKGDTAAQQPQLKSLEQLSKDLALAAATASGGGGGNGVKNQQEFWAKTLEAMKDAKTNGVSIRTILEQILAGVLKIPGVGGATTAQPPGPSTGGLGGIGRVAGKAILGALPGGNIIAPLL